jgi:hypothetical protein
MKIQKNVTKFGTLYFYVKQGRTIFHNDDGPALEYNRGDVYWMKHGKIHRLDGPAACYRSGDEEWFIEGIKLNKSEISTLKSLSKDKIDQFVGLLKLNRYGK